MAEFMPEPVMTLETMDDVRRAIVEPKAAPFGLSSLEKYRIKSVWLIALIGEIASAGKFPYNSAVKQLASDRLGLGLTDAAIHSESDTLSTLVYNAQRYRRSDLLKAEGFSPFTKEMLATAHTTRQGIELQGESLLGAAVRSVLKVREIDGNLYAMKPKMRKRHFAPNGQPARLVMASTARGSR